MLVLVLLFLCLLSEAELSTSLRVIASRSVEDNMDATILCKLILDWVMYYPICQLEFSEEE